MENFGKAEAENGSRRRIKKEEEKIVAKLYQIKLYSWTEYLFKDDWRVNTHSEHSDLKKSFTLKCILEEIIWVIQRNKNFKNSSRKWLRFLLKFL